MDTKILGAITTAPDVTNDDFFVGTRSALGVYTDYKYSMADLVAYLGTSGGVPTIVDTGRHAAQTAAVASVVAYTVGASDGSFVVSGNVNVTTSGSESFEVTVAYTDETNMARTQSLKFMYGNSGTISSTVAAANGALPYNGLSVRIRCKAATSITVATAGTFTGCTYNVEADITQMI